MIHISKSYPHVLQISCIVRFKKFYMLFCYRTWHCSITGSQTRARHEPDNKVRGTRQQTLEKTGR